MNSSAYCWDRLGHWAVGRAEKAYAVAYLFFEQFVQFLQVDAGEVLACLAIGPARAEKSGEHDRFDMPDDFLQVPYVGQAFTFLGNVFFLAGRGVRTVCLHCRVLFVPGLSF